MIVFIIIFFFSEYYFAQSQDSLFLYEGIPTIIYGADKSDENLLDSLRGLGGYAVVAMQMTKAYHDSLTNIGYKIFPYQVWDQGIFKRWIHYYSQSHYSNWEAEEYSSTQYSLNYNSSICSLATTPFGGIVTKNNANMAGKVILNGPDYNQESLRRVSDRNGYIQYRVKMNYKLEEVDSTGSDIFSVYLFAGSEILDSLTFDRNELTLGIWDSLIVEYNLGDIHLSDQEIPDQQKDGLVINEPMENTLDYFVVRNVAFSLKILSNDFVVHVDNVEIFDGMGQALVNGSYNTRISSQVVENDYSQTSSGIVGWITLDEPWVIDNYYPQYFIDSLVNVYGGSNDKDYLRATTTWTSGRENIDTSSMEKTILRSKEYNRIAKPRAVWINQYPYDYPIKNSFSNWALDSNLNVAATAYDALNDYADYFGVTIQAHGFHDESLTNAPFWQARPPQRKELLNHFNLGLLYGAKEILIYNLASTYANDEIRTLGILDTNGNAIDYRYKTLRDTIIARCNSKLGKKLRNLNEFEQFKSIDATYMGNINKNFIKRIYSKGSGIYDTVDVDLGFFNEEYNDNDNYFMYLNRHYNDRNIFEIKFSFDEYYNYKVTDYVDEYNFYVTQNSTKIGAFDDTLEYGDANLFLMEPCIAVGGYLSVDDTISSNISLNGKLEIDSLAILVIDEEYDIYENIHINNGGMIELVSYGNLNLYNDAIIEAENWNSLLFGARTDDTTHPRLVIAKHATIIPTYYEIYRRISSSGTWNMIDTTSANEYIDSSQSILLPGQLAGAELFYKIIAVINGGGGKAQKNTTNVVEYPIPSNETGKRAEALETPSEYSLAQNYPNPFNPVTKIEYSIPELSKVRIEVFDLLGRRVIMLVNEIKEPGKYSVSFNGGQVSSGVYFFTIKANKYIATKKMVLLK